jgi:hypothetical protein
VTDYQVPVIEPAQADVQATHEIVQIHVPTHPMYKTEVAQESKMQTALSEIEELQN